MGDGADVHREGCHHVAPIAEQTFVCYTVA